VEPLKWQLDGSFEFVGAPSDEDLARGEEFGRAFAANIKET